MKNLKVFSSIFLLNLSLLIFAADHKDAQFSKVTEFVDMPTISHHFCGPKIGDNAPSFRAMSTEGPINFPHDFANQWIILFSHPADFTPVCATEFKRLAQMVDELRDLNCELVGLSVDSEYTHEIWMRNLEKSMEREQKQKRTLNFPVIADVNRKIAKLYGMIHPNESTTQTVRSIYFIDPNRKIRAIFYYPISNGRNFNEMKRMLIALQTTDKYNVATPADWKPGQRTIAKEKAIKDIMPE